ncbi:trans-L-3-hydroxyproline dehydratase-like [Anneissia japonica]|uniref:trans-L-3-hydroxyproline dehydratase-like n=1 Tax=Anneissia japonica TaxID=1529436 RepID=UPI0014254B8B|nr:trans-L-3-hydroxyproline dehydratase-like [Anneissia japonica]XP_033104943.1 trans-L-3-hydroxyproline dehydratase-like [Anneissia japonica]
MESPIKPGCTSTSPVIKTIEMHTGGEPLRVIISGYPEILGDTILQKRQYVKENLDHLRKMLMFEPRGHYDMYGALLVDSDLPEADIAVLFLHNEGYSTMCGHAIVSLGRLAIDKMYVPPTEPETEVNIQCPCGLVKTFVEYKNGKSGGVRFHSVPAFLFASGIEVEVDGFGKIKVDISYGGAFYAFVCADVFGLDVRSSPTSSLKDVATAVSNAVRKRVKLHHPDDSDLEFLYGTILTDGQDKWSGEPTANICVFANAQVDRCPTGSGVTARIALQHAKSLIQLGQKRLFESGANKTLFTGMAVKQTKCGDFDAVVVEVAGHGYYTGEASFMLEEEDVVGKGFLLR